MSFDNAMNHRDPARLVSQRLPGCRVAGGWRSLAGMVFALACLAGGCTSWVVKKAFEGEFSSTENNRIINDYCTSCHIHREFSASAHLDEVSPKYRRKVFRYATECRTCHYLEINLLTEVVERRTRRPAEANRGLFRDFEVDKIKEQRERANQEVFKKPPIRTKEDKKFLGIF